MSNNYSTTKDLGKAVSIIMFMILGVPMLMVMSFEEYPKYCKMSILVPCIGVLIDEN
jgi:hypothetical protein|tara:strand:- start:703 stop:873 length:171 start_codon:yes stop_codon:yes gene_type:complete